MKQIIGRKDGNRHLLTYSLLFLGYALVVLVISGCSPNIVAIKRDQSVDRMVAANQLPESYNYYMIGTRHRPYAVLGLMPEYTLSNTHWWEPVRRGAPAAARMMEKVRDFYWWESHFGGIVKDPEGNSIGILYSGEPGSSVKVDSENRKVHVIMEDPWSSNNPYITKPSSDDD